MPELLLLPLLLLLLLLLLTLLLLPLLQPPPLLLLLLLTLLLLPLLQLPLRLHRNPPPDLCDLGDVVEIHGVSQFGMPLHKLAITV